MKKFCSSAAFLFVMVFGYSQINYQLTDDGTIKASITNIISDTITVDNSDPGMAKTRNLTNDEKELLSLVFVKTLPLDRILIADNLGIGGNPYTTSFLTNKYRIHAGDYYYKNGFMLDCAGMSLLVHEAVHVWQGVHGIFKWDYIVNSLTCQAIEIGMEVDATGIPWSLLISDAACGTGSYNPVYNYKLGKDWMWYNAEEQATIVEDWFLNGMSISDERWPYIRDNLRKPGFGGQIYFFNQNQYLRWTIDKGVDEGFPRSTTEHWNSFVKDANTAFSRLVGEKEFVYFFKGNEYLKWKLGSGPVDGYPKKIANEWNSDFIKNGIDAALCTDNNRVYFFKGDEYIRYTFGVGQDKGYPKKISESFNSSFIKDGFDACCYWGNGKAYFFKDDQYIRYTIGEGVDSGYPKNTASIFNSWMLYGIKFVILKRKDCF